MLKKEVGTPPSMQSLSEEHCSFEEALQGERDMYTCLTKLFVKEAPLTKSETKGGILPIVRGDTKPPEVTIPTGVETFTGI